MPSLLTVVADEILHWTRSRESFLLPKGAWNTHGTTGPVPNYFVRHASCPLGCYSASLDLDAEVCWKNPWPETEEDLVLKLGI
ncbi:unnamed protein product [Boreogadus saida]